MTSNLSSRGTKEKIVNQASPITRTKGKANQNMMTSQNVLMISMIFWNIRRVKSRGTFERLNFLSKIYKTQFIEIQEPFAQANKIK